MQQTLKADNIFRTKNSDGIRVKNYGFTQIFTPVDILRKHYIHNVLTKHMLWVLIIQSRKYVSLRIVIITIFNDILYANQLI